MKKIEVRHFGEPEVLELVECEVYIPSAQEILVKIEAVGVNPVETYVRAGTYPTLPSLPYTPGGNAAGTVAACGKDVTAWKIGNRVYTSGTRTGAYAEFCLCDADQLFSLPDVASFAQGAGLGVPAATAWRALFFRGGAKHGEKLLVHGGSGSVGQAAIQFAKSHGLTVYATAGNEEGCALIEQYGAHAFNHRTPDYIGKIARISGGVDLILEMLANVNLEADLTLLNPSGRVVVIGSRGRIEIDPRATMGKETDIRGFALFNASLEELVATHRGIHNALVDGSYVPRISVELKLADAAEAHRLVMKDGNHGKIVLRP